MFTNTLGSRSEARRICWSKIYVISKSGGNTTPSIFDPIRLTQHVLDNSPRLAQHYGDVVVELGSERRWRLLLGFDEQTLGSKVNAANKRKNMVRAVAMPSEYVRAAMPLEFNLRQCRLQKILLINMHTYLSVCMHVRILLHTSLQGCRRHCRCLFAFVRLFGRRCHLEFVTHKQKKRWVLTRSNIHFQSGQPPASRRARLIQFFKTTKAC